ncbi:MAG: ExeM/NucH family extracellular endonuclease [Paludibacteraceae bacterium]
MKIKIIILFSVYILQLSAQTPLSIPEIQGSGNASSHSGKSVKTSGIVTAKYIGTGKIGGFFLQDAFGDGNTNTSDGIFVFTSIDNVNAGDKIELVATVNEYNGKTQLINPASIVVLATNQPLPVTKVVFDPATFSWEKYEGMLLEFDQILYVNSNRNLQRYGELELGDRRKPSPTNITLPGTEAFQAQVNRNYLTPIYLDDAITTSYNSPIVFADENGTRRTGERVKNLQAVVDYTNSKYVIYPVSFPINFYGNPRPTAPADLGNYNLKICGFNLEYYLTSSNSSGMGPSSQTEMENQHTKIVEALKAIDADIYGLVEIEQGQDALSKLARALTSSTGKAYSFVNDGGSVNGTYTKAAYLYRSDKVSPYLSLKSNNSPPINRKKLQAFTLKSNGEKFVFSINHFKAKSGCSSATGNDADQGDGQSCYNATRTGEANSVMQFINTNKTYYGDEDALVMGDLNAYAKEDPIRTFTNAGYVDLHQFFHPDTSYSYVYNGEAGYLDHALANESMAKQITGVSVFHINADEPAVFEYSGSNYQPNMYRCSDHDPVVVGISLKLVNNTTVSIFDEKVKLYPSVTSSYFTIENAKDAYIQLYSLSGVKLYENQLQTDKETINAKEIGLSVGAYIVRVLGEGSIARRFLFVK